MPAAGAALVGLAGVAYQRNDLSAALAHLDEGIPLGRQFVHTPPLTAGLVTLAWIRHATGTARRPGRNRGGATVLCRSGRPVQSSTGTVRQTAAGPGDLEAAAQWTETAGHADRELAYPREIGHLVLARVLLAQDHRIGRSRYWIRCTPQRSTSVAPQASSRSVPFGG